MWTSQSWELYSPTPSWFISPVYATNSDIHKYLIKAWVSVGTATKMEGRPKLWWCSYIRRLVLFMEKDGKLTLNSDIYDDVSLSLILSKLVVVLTTIRFTKKSPCNALYVSVVFHKDIWKIPFKNVPSVNFPSNFPKRADIRNFEAGGQSHCPLSFRSLLVYFVLCKAFDFSFLFCCLKTS